MSENDDQDLHDEVRQINAETAALIHAAITSVSNGKISDKEKAAFDSLPDSYDLGEVTTKGFEIGFTKIEVLEDGKGGLGLFRKNPLESALSDGRISDKELEKIKGMGFTVQDTGSADNGNLAHVMTRGNIKITARHEI